MRPAFWPTPYLLLCTCSQYLRSVHLRLVMKERRSFESAVALDGEVHGTWRCEGKEQADLFSSCMFL